MLHESIAEWCLHTSYQSLCSTWISLFLWWQEFGIFTAVSLSYLNFHVSRPRSVLLDILCLKKFFLLYNTRFQSIHFSICLCLYRLFNQIRFTYFLSNRFFLFQWSMFPYWWILPITMLMTVFSSKYLRENIKSIVENPVLADVTLVRWSKLVSPVIYVDIRYS